MNFNSNKENCIRSLVVIVHVNRITFLFTRYRERLVFLITLGADNIPFRQYIYRLQRDVSSQVGCYLLMAARVKASRVFMSRLICKRLISYVRRRSKYQPDFKDVRP